MRRIKAWLLADDVSNELGGGCLVSAMRVMFVAVVLVVLASLGVLLATIGDVLIKIL